MRLKRIPGGICCNGVPARTVDPVSAGDCITLTEPAAEHTLPPLTTCTVPILQETASWILYDKPDGMPVHPSHGHRTDTLGNVFAAAHPELPFRPVYRLDRDTSGICLAAKSAYSAAFLQGRVEKTYLALVCGTLQESGTISAPIGRADGSVIRRCVRQDGKSAVTHYRPLRQDGMYTLVELTLETGRTHQIRVHMASLGYPLAGDTMYGGSTAHFSRHMLHCCRVAFPDPESGERITAECPFQACEAYFAAAKI